MAYTLTTSDGSVTITIPDGQFDNSTGLTFAGPNAVGYGQSLDQNILTLLDNFASNSSPSGTNLQGQLWFNKSNQTLNVFTTQGYLPVSGITISTSQPTNANPGNTWFNSSTNQYYFYDGTNWNLIGPLYTKANGVSGAIPVVVNDASIAGVTHNIVKLQFGNVVIATLSSDSPFVPSPGIDGFSQIRPGITLNSSITNTALNTNVVGNLTGDVVGNLTGNVTATTLSGSLTGNVTGNVLATTVLTNTLTATTITGNTVSQFGQATNFSTGNALITGGTLTGLANVATVNLITSTITGTTATFSGTISATSPSFAGTPTAPTANPGTNTAQIATTAFVSNAVTTGINGLSTMAFQSANNVNIIGGNIGGITNLSATAGTLNVITSTNQTTTNLVATNFITGNAVITGGYINSVANISTPVLTATNSTIGTLGATNFVTGNAVITGGTVSGLSSLSATTLSGTTLSLSSALTGTTATFSGAISATSPSFAGTPTAPTANPGTNTAQIATTAFVQHVASSLGTMSSQNGTSVNITGGSITGSYALNAATATTAGYASSAGNGGVTSVNGSSGAVTIAGLGLSGTSWHAVGRAFNTQYTNSYNYPIAVSATATCAVTSTIQAYVNGMLIAWYQWQFNGCGSYGGTFIIVPPGATYQLNSSQGVQNWVELY